MFVQIYYLYSFAFVSSEENAKKKYIFFLIFASLDPVYYGRNIRVILMHATKVLKESKFL